MRLLGVLKFEQISLIIHFRFRDILMGRREIAVVPRDDGSTFCLHADLPTAKDTIRRLKECKEAYDIHIAMAHDATWVLSRGNEVLMSMLSPYFDDACLDRIRAGVQP